MRNTEIIKLLKYCEIINDNKHISEIRFKYCFNTLNNDDFHLTNIVEIYLIKDKFILNKKESIDLDNLNVDYTYAYLDCPLENLKNFIIFLKDYILNYKLNKT